MKGVHTMAIISDIVTELRNIKTSITTALSNKGVTSSGQWENFGNEINSISSGIKPYKLNVINNYSKQQSYSCTFQISGAYFTQTGTTLNINQYYTAYVSVDTAPGYKPSKDVYSVEFSQNNPNQTLTLLEPLPLDRQGLPILPAGTEIAASSLNVYWLRDQYMQSGIFAGGGINATSNNLLELKDLNANAQSTYKAGGTIYFNINKALVLNIIPYHFLGDDSPYKLVVTIIDINNKQLGNTINVPLTSSMGTDINLPVGAKGIVLATDNPNFREWLYYIRVK